jgi:hypothetical protein
MIDLVIRGGLVVDGTGAAGRQADVAIADGRISAVGEVRERGAREIDAGGLVVAPGFIDVHTHYDAQYTWDPYATSSIWHGVTTTVIGNCGFAIAPCRPADRDLIMRTLVKVEGMSLAAMRTGITWGFETFPEYLDHLERCNPSLNVAALVGHSTIRQWVMGGDSQHRVATSEEVEAMARMVREAMAAGAIGLGSSTAEAHVGENGLPVASRMADKSEFLALTRAMGESGRGLFQATIGSKTSMEDLGEIWRTSGRPVIWAAFFQRDDLPEYVPERLAATLSEAGRWSKVSDLGEVYAGPQDGSNNWAVAPSRTATGRPLLATDPHRVYLLPSIRYIVHLSAPGWNVIGAGEPALPGVSVGHNEKGAWGFTIFPIDQEDLYVYETRPDAPNEYRYRDRWEPMNVVEESVSILDAAPTPVTRESASTC